MRCKGGLERNGYLELLKLFKFASVEFLVKKIFNDEEDSWLSPYMMKV